MVTIVFAHPWHGSFNKAILDTVTAKYEADKKPYQVIDLNKDGFDPVMTEKDLSTFGKGISNDPLVIKYQKMLKEANEMVFIFPIWWGSFPAILKGFFDKVLLKDYAYSDLNGWTPLLKSDKTTVITTSQNYTTVFEPSIQHHLIPLILESVGISNDNWYNCEQTGSGTDEYRKAFLDKVASVL